MYYQPLSAFPKEWDTHMATADTVSNRFFEEMKRLGFSQTSFAAKVGLSKVTISHYVLGRHLPSSEVLIKMDALGGDVLYVLTGKHANPPAPKSSIDFNRLGAAIQESVRQMGSTDATSNRRSLAERAWTIYEAWDVIVQGSASSSNS